MKLIAAYPILYRATQYQIGQEIPADDPAMVQAWLDAGTAKWIGTDQEKVKKTDSAKMDVPERADNISGAIEKTSKMASRSRTTVKND